MITPQDGCLLRVFIGESDKKDGMSLYEWIIRRAKQDNIAGATVLRAIEGYGSHNFIHTTKILQLSTDLPVIVEIMDTDEKIKAFMPILDEVVHNGLVTMEKIQMRFYRSTE